MDFYQVTPTSVKSFKITLRRNNELKKANVEVVFLKDPRRSSSSVPKDMLFLPTPKCEVILASKRGIQNPYHSACLEVRHVLFTASATRSSCLRSHGVHHVPMCQIGMFFLLQEVMFSSCLKMPSHSCRRSATEIPCCSLCSIVLHDVLCVPKWHVISSVPPTLCSFYSVACHGLYLYISHLTFLTKVVFSKRLSLITFFLASQCVQLLCLVQFSTNSCCWIQPDESPKAVGW